MKRNSRIILAGLAVTMMLAGPVTAQEAATSPKVQVLWPGRAPGAKGDAEGDKPTLTIYLPAEEKATGAAVVISVLAFNFVGDGLRDAADPYAR